MTASLQISENRSSRKYSLKTQVARVLWAFGRCLFRVVPRPLYAPRNTLLRWFGSTIGRHVQISNTAIVYFPWQLTVGDDVGIGDGARLYNLGPLNIGSRVTISQGAHLCGGTHDYRDRRMPLIRSPITVENDAWICADAFVGPGVTIGAGAVVGARAVAMRTVDPWQVVTGNPAQVIKQRVLSES